MSNGGRSKSPSQPETPRLDVRDLRFVDATYVEHVLSDEYLPAIDSFTQQEVARAFNSADALLWCSINGGSGDNSNASAASSDQSLPIGRQSQSLLQCVATWIGLLCQVTCVLHQIPGCQTECEQVMIGLMTQFLERCELKFRELITSSSQVSAGEANSSGSDGTATVFVASSSQFVTTSAQLRDLLQQHSMFHDAEDISSDDSGADESVDAIIAEKEILLLERLKDDRSLHKNEIILEYKTLRSLLLLQRSLVSCGYLPRFCSSFSFSLAYRYSMIRSYFLGC
jgi:hypothetical protein